MPDLLFGKTPYFKANSTLKLDSISEVSMQNTSVYMDFDLQFPFHILCLYEILKSRILCISYPKTR
jgi:hypothetical protein